MGVIMNTIQKIAVASAICTLAFTAAHAQHYFDQDQVQMRQMEFEQHMRQMDIERHQMEMDRRLQEMDRQREEQDRRMNSIQMQMDRYR